MAGGDVVVAGSRNRYSSGDPDIGQVVHEGGNKDEPIEQEVGEGVTEEAKALQREGFAQD